MSLIVLGVLATVVLFCMALCCAGLAAYVCREIWCDVRPNWVERWLIAPALAVLSLSLPGLTIAAAIHGWMQACGS